MLLVVLGAGATRGASFVNEKPGICLPPLDSDFFTQLQRINSKVYNDIINDIITDMVELFGHNFRVTMEDAFSTIENTLRIVETTHKEGLLSTKRLLSMRKNLVSSVAAVLRESLIDHTNNSEMKPCIYHNELIRCLQHHDVIISLNYDCLVDEALKRNGYDKWYSRYGYCLPLPKGRNSKLQGEENWNHTNATNPSQKDNTILLFKLHGSMHFRSDDGKIIQLSPEPYPEKKIDQIMIIPPVPNKRFDEGVFGLLWKKAANEIYKATDILIIGYSFPQTDIHASSLFRVCLKKESLCRITIVNPDHEARKRTRSIFQRGFTKSTRVLVFDTFEEFHHALEHGTWAYNYPIV